MIFDFGQFWESIRVTAEYSNAVLAAVLPCFSDYAKKLELPVPHPIEATDVAQFGVVPILVDDRQPLGTSMQLKNGWILTMKSGFMVGFRGPNCYEMIQDPDQIPKVYGPVKMSKVEAVEMARKTILKLGITLESVFADQEPRATGPQTVDGHIIPRYTIQWSRPDLTSDSQVTAEGDWGDSDVEVEVNAEAKRVEMLRFSLRVCQQSLPCHLIKVGIDPPVSPSNVVWPPINPEYARRLVPIVLHAIDDYGQTLHLPIPRPLTTNQVARFSVADNGGWEHSEVELTNGWRFIYRNSMVNGFYAPDNLFSSDKRTVRVKDFLGKRNMTEPEAIQLVCASIKRLSYPTNLVHTDFQPIVRTSRMPGIPRFWIEWVYAPNDELQSKVEAEIDADKKELKSLYYDDQAYWNHPPKIDVPITLSDKTGQPR